MTRSITQSEYKRFVAEFSTWLGCTVVGRKGVLEMEALGTFLDLAGIADRDDFLDQTATTLGTVIYLPDAWSLDKKVDVLVHEGKHVWQYDRPAGDNTVGTVLDAAQKALLAWPFSPVITSLLERTHLDESKLRASGLGFMWLYLAHPEERAKFEAHAYATGMEFAKRRWGTLQSHTALVDRMRHGYAIDGEDVALASKILESRRVEINLGVYRSSVSTKAIEILMGIAPDLVADRGGA